MSRTHEVVQRHRLLLRSNDCTLHEEFILAFCGQWRLFLHCLEHDYGRRQHISDVNTREPGGVTNLAHPRSLLARYDQNLAVHNRAEREETVACSRNSLKAQVCATDLRRSCLHLERDWVFIIVGYSKDSFDKLCERTWVNSVSELSTKRYDFAHD